MIAKRVHPCVDILQSWTLSCVQADIVTAFSRRQKHTQARSLCVRNGFMSAVWHRSVQIRALYQFRLFFERCQLNFSQEKPVEDRADLLKRASTKSIKAVIAQPNLADVHLRSMIGQFQKYFSQSKGFIPATITPSAAKLPSCNPRPPTGSSPTSSAMVGHGDEPPSRPTRVTSLSSATGSGRTTAPAAPSQAPPPSGLSAKAIATLLAPWMDVFLTEFECVDHERDKTTEVTGFVNVIAKLTGGPECSTTSSYAPSADAKYARKSTRRVWEAMQLLDLAVAIDSRVLMALNKFKLVEKTSWRVKKNLTHEVCTLRFVLSLHSLNTRMLHKYIGERFFKNPLADPASHAKYLGVRRQLMSEAKRRCVQTRLAQPLEVSFKITMPNGPLEPSTTLEAEDFFTHLTDFVVQIRLFQKTGNLFLAPARRLRIGYIELKDWGGLVITEHVVRAVERLMRKSKGLVICKSVTLDPRTIACNEDDLTAYVNAFESDLAVTLGGHHCLLKGFRLDTYGEDRRKNIETILRAVSRCRYLRVLNIGPMLLRFGETCNRRVFWYHLVTGVLSGEHSSALQKIKIDADHDGLFYLDDQDASFIRSAREQVGDRLREVEELEMDVENVDASALIELTGLTRGMKVFKLQSSFCDPFDSLTVYRTLQHCPAVQKLQIGGIRVDSMKVFVDFCEWRAASGAGVDSLTISDFYISNESSIALFFRALGNPNSAFANRLTALVMFEYSRCWNPFFALDASCLKVIDSVLRTNRVLQTLHLVVREDVPENLKDVILSHNGAIVLCTKSRPDHNRRKAAFLSAIRCAPRHDAVRRLDTYTLLLIFAFSHPYVTRDVQVATRGPP